MAIVFDPTSHKYTLDGAVVPSVTTVLRATGAYEHADLWTREARDRGTSVHALIAMCHCAGSLPEGTKVNYQSAPHIDAYCRWREESPAITPMEWEVVLAHQQLGFAGTPDLLAKCKITGAWILIDFKTGPIQPAYTIQMAAYELLVCEGINSAAHLVLPVSKINESWVIELKKNGRYSITALSQDQRDVGKAKFKQALELYKKGEQS